MFERLKNWWHRTHPVINAGPAEKAVAEATEHASEIAAKSAQLEGRIDPLRAMIAAMQAPRVNRRHH